MYKFIFYLPVQSVGLELQVKQGYSQSIHYFSVLFQYYLETVFSQFTVEHLSAAVQVTQGGKHFKHYSPSS